MSPHQLSRAEVAAHFKVSTKTIDRLMKRRKIRWIYVGRQPRFSLDECQACFERAAIPTTTRTRRAAA